MEIFGEECKGEKLRLMEVMERDVIRGGFVFLVIFEFFFFGIYCFDCEKKISFCFCFREIRVNGYGGNRNCGLYGLNDLVYV